MFFSMKKSRKKIREYSGCIEEFPESLVNPLYKPKTLSELKALMVHTGINPSPQPLRPGVPESEGVDAMDSPPAVVTGDTFEIIRQGQAIQRDIESKESALKDALAEQKQDPALQDPAE